MGVFNVNKPITQIGTENTLNFGSIIKGTILCYIITLIMFAVFATALLFTDFPGKFIYAVVIITTVVSVIIGGTVAGHSAKSMGWLNGAIMGIFYVVVLYFIGSIINKNFAIEGNTLMMACIAIASGAVGGMIGINFRWKKRG